MQSEREGNIARHEEGRTARQRANAYNSIYMPWKCRGVACRPALVLQCGCVLERWCDNDWPAVAVRRRGPPSRPLRCSFRFRLNRKTVYISNLKKNTYRLSTVTYLHLHLHLHTHISSKSPSILQHRRIFAATRDVRLIWLPALRSS